MMPEGESKRTLVECLECGSAYAAAQWPDGTVQPIGTKNGCQCGSTEFQAVEETSTTDFHLAVARKPRALARGGIAFVRVSTRPTTAPRCPATSHLGVAPLSR
ncbi:hypothetical protein CV102_25140 [Natronococcus pandeyae]|uniref:Uncharacterized protein n=1 Tax=Natronococcus pandeyae TaxID=2055836 RepID=A0A8J8TMU3_9EURY|nr:hypothetical protein CV102_25140 [Natronococcus pandeyae]